VRVTSRLLGSACSLALAVSACVSVRHVEPPRAEPAELPERPVAFDFPSLDGRSVSSAAFRGKPAVIAFVVSDTLAAQAEADVLARFAVSAGDGVTVAIVAVEPPERRELVQGFVKFFVDGARVPLRAAMADEETRSGQGPFGDVRSQTVVVLDGAGRMRLRTPGVVLATEIARALPTR
jgi:hypothetical protein